MMCSTVALRLGGTSASTFSHLLSSAKRVALDAFAHGATPFAKVVDALGVSRSAAYTPVYQVLLTVDSEAEAGADGQWPGLSAKAAGMASDSAMTDLLLSLSSKCAPSCSLAVIIPTLHRQQGNAVCDPASCPHVAMLSMCDSALHPHSMMFPPQGR